MKIEKRTKIVPVYNTVYDGLEIISQEHICDEEISVTDIYADEGMIFVDKASRKVLSEHITLGTEDRAENYTEVDKFG